MNENTKLLSAHAYEFLIQMKSVINFWNEQTTITDHGIDATLARLRGLAADILRLVDSADSRGWNMVDVAYEINVEFNEDAEDNPDVLLLMPVEDLEKQFDLALCRNWEADDVARPIYDGVQWVGGASAKATSSETLSSPDHQEANSDEG